MRCMSDALHTRHVRTATDICRSRLETQIKETQGKIDNKRTEIIQVQTAAQQAAGNAGAQ